MKKKMVAYILIGIGLLAALYYFFVMKKNNPGSDDPADGTAADKRGALAAEDDANYKKMWALIPGSDRAWVGDLVKSDYESGLDQNAGDLPLVNGVVTKSAALQSVFFQSAPNSSGDYTVTSNGNTFKSLWPQKSWDKMWQLWAGFKNRHSAL